MVEKIINQEDFRGPKLIFNEYSGREIKTFQALLVLPLGADSSQEFVSESFTSKNDATAKLYKRIQKHFETLYEKEKEYKKAFPSAPETTTADLFNRIRDIFPAEIVESLVTEE